MKRIIILLIFMLALCADAQCYDYREQNIFEARKSDYENSDVIFLGIPVSIEDDIGKFIVVEAFKGELPKEIYVDLSESIGNREAIFTLWIVYGKNTDSRDTMRVDVSSVQTRSVEQAGLAEYGALPPPILKGGKDEEMHLFFEAYLDKLYFNHWRNYFYDEIEVLRGLKKYYDVHEEIASDSDFQYHSLLYAIFIGIVVLTIVVVGLTVMAVRLNRRP